LIGVIDSSVAVKWYVEEIDSDRAAGLIGLELVAPDIIRVEVANALWKKVRKGEIEEGQTVEALPHLSAAVKIMPSTLLIGAAFEAAVELRHPVYDCVFLVLSQELRLPLITSDERLCRHVHNTRFEALVTPLRTWKGS
jgi:predicted nucleic acid-binding protein